MEFSRIKTGDRITEHIALGHEDKQIDRERLAESFYTKSLAKETTVAAYKPLLPVPVGVVTTPTSESHF